MESVPSSAFDADLERRFGGLRRLYGDVAYARLRGLHVVVVGLGGVGSWAVEALARSGVAALTLVDLDHVSESNVNRQIQALESTLGQSKAEALRDRIAQIHPGCRVTCIEEFVDETNWPALLNAPEGAAAAMTLVPDVAVDADGDGEIDVASALAIETALQARPRVDALIDACDQVRAKGVLAAWALDTSTPLIMVGAAGGKRRPQAVEADDLSRVTHDPLLASLRQRLRKFHGAARTGEMGLRCVFSREPVMQPEAAVCKPGEATPGGENDGSLNCHGYGSTVTVTATFGMVAAAEALEAALEATRPAGSAGRSVQPTDAPTNKTPEAWPSALTVI